MPSAALLLEAPIGIASDLRLHRCWGENDAMCCAAVHCIPLEDLTLAHAFDSRLPHIVCVQVEDGLVLASVDFCVSWFPYCALLLLV